MAQIVINIHNIMYSEHLQALLLLVQPVMSVAYVEFPILTVHC